MRLENSYTFYRAQFDVVPLTSDFDTQVPVLSVLRNWVCEKENGRSDGHASAIAMLLNAYDGSGVETFVRGVQLPESYDGGTSPHAGTFLRTFSYVGEGTSDSPQFWAMDYDEPDKKHGMRRWHTSAGVQTRCNASTVSVRITNYVIPGFIGQEPPQPPITTPLFVRRILGLSGCQCRVGDTVLEEKAVYLSRSNFESRFLESLLSERRELPLVLAVSRSDGTYPSDVRVLARKLAGVANVYALDYSAGLNRIKLDEHFGLQKHLWCYRVDPGCVRIFNSHVDVSSKGDYKRHRFFTSNIIDDYGASFPDVLRSSLTRAWFHDDSDIADVSDVLAIERRVRANSLRERLQSLQAQTKESLTKETAERVELEKKAKDLAQKTQEWQDLAESYAVDQDGYQKRESEMKKRVKSLETQAGRLQRECNTVRADSIRYRADASALKKTLEAYEGVTHIPTKLSEVLALVQELYSDRLVVLHEAKVSAKRFDGRYNLDDEWVILRSIPTTLWHLYFDDQSSADIEDAYKRETTFELSLTEGSQTNDGSDYRKLRRRTYEGKTITVNAHIKGKSNRKGNTFRVHYWVDHEQRKIVIGHCGDHITSPGTREAD